MVTTGTEFCAEHPTTIAIDPDPAQHNICDCGYHFKEEDPTQRFVEQVYVNLDTKEKFVLKEAPVGAMWYASWLQDIFPGPDGKSLVVRTPGGDWNIDSMASNCDMRDDKVHRCWVRHGSVPNITVDKNGNTCKAGAGSIAKGKYHGFLQKGYLTHCP